MSEHPIVDAQELASILGVSVQSVRNWVRSGLIPPSTYIKVERTYRFVVSDVIESLRANRVVPELPEGTADQEVPVQARTKQPITIDLSEEDER